jgi:vitamin-K-epoxide reductase (warfarin-sensitive)
MKTYRLFASFVGIAASLYAIHVEMMHNEIGDEYVAECDLSETISCSKVLTSEWAHLFSALGMFPKDSLLDQSNAVYGLVFYVIIGVFATFESRSDFLLAFNFFAATSGILMSCILAYILATILHDLCIVCVTTYFCTSFIFYDTLKEWKEVAKSKSS